MNDIEQKALALVNEVRTERGWQPHRTLSQYDCSRTLTLCRTIEQHEAFRQEVSDAVVAAKAYYEVPMYDLSAFIIAKPDPLVEVLEEWLNSHDLDEAASFRAVIKKRGGKIIFNEE